MFDKVILQETADSLFRKHQTLAVAESVTAGLLQAAFAAAENATAFFQGGITAYNAKQKYTHLHIDILHAISCNCVSESTASEMALGVSNSFLSDWGIGITGYASPLPGHDMNPLYAHFAISFKNDVVKSGKITTNIKEPLQVQLVYVNRILKELLDVLNTIDRID
ncbi:MAG: CinA family protein [Ferruginibacter sp.]|uniref:CinA family protein n=1 Tax=Ferruginibacter sp. TaxID=1940288 RepID=UPI002657E293|nr:nicotinamide-nucleotide amidohydrolase family protein [Ferruginibacter sp.]MDB5279599.1 CinA family protein [Ferruginibacter sp.]